MDPLERIAVELDGIRADLRAMKDAITVPRTIWLTRAEIEAHQDRIIEQDDRRARRTKYGG